MLKSLLGFVALSIMLFCACTKTTVTLKNASAHDARHVWVGQKDQQGDIDSLSFGDIPGGTTGTTQESDFYGLGFLRFSILDSIYDFKDVDITAYNDNCFVFDSSGVSVCPADTTPP